MFVCVRVCLVNDIRLEINDSYFNFKGQGNQVNCKVLGILNIAILCCTIELTNNLNSWTHTFWNLNWLVTYRHTHWYTVWTFECLNDRRCGLLGTKTDINRMHQALCTLFGYDLKVNCLKLQMYTQSDNSCNLDDNKENNERPCYCHETGHPFIWYEGNWLRSHHSFICLMQLCIYHSTAERIPIWVSDCWVVIWLWNVK